MVPYSRLVAGAEEDTADVDDTAVGLADIEAVEVEEEVAVYDKGGNLNYPSQIRTEQDEPLESGSAAVEADAHDSIADAAC